MADQKPSDNEPLPERAIAPELTRWRTRKEAAALMGICINHLDDLVREHGVPVIKLGRTVRFDEAAIEFLAAACRVERAPARRVVVAYHSAQRKAEIERAFQNVRKMTAKPPKKPRGRKWKRAGKGAST